MDVDAGSPLTPLSTPLGSDARYAGPLQAAISMARTHPPPHWPHPLSPASAYAALGRRDLSLLLGAPRGVSTTSITASGSGSVGVGEGARRRAYARLLVPPPVGYRLGVPMVAGMTGKPQSEPAQAAAAAALMINACLGIGDRSAGAHAWDDCDGLDALCGPFSALRFPADRRVAVAAGRLRSCRPHRLSLPPSHSSTDHEQAEEQLLAVLQNARATAAAPLGRGMLTWGSSFPSHADPVPIPVLTLAVRVPPKDFLVKTDVSHTPTQSAGLMEWPEFLNGAATGLRITSPLDVGADHWDNEEEGEGGGGSSTSVNPVGGGAASGATDASSRRRALRSWVRSHRFSGVPPDLAEGFAAMGASAGAAAPPGSAAALAAAGVPSGSNGMVPPNAAHGGLLLAFGLGGLLNAMTPVDLYEYLRLGHATTSIGLLLGVAAGRRGSGDDGVAKAISLHLPASLPGSYADLDVPSVVQVNALVALGLLHQGTRHSASSEFLLRQMRRAPVATASDKAWDRDAYAAAAGFAYGLINLGLGGRAQGSHHAAAAVNSGGGGGGGGSSEHVDYLVMLMVGGREAHSSLHGGQDGTDTPARSPTASTPASQQPPVLTREVPGMMNIHTTAFPAALALTLAYLRTDNDRIARMLAPPLTLPLLDAVRYDVLAVRAMGRGLIMWGEHDDADADRFFHHPSWRAAREAEGAGGAVAAAAGPVEAMSRWEHARRAGFRAWLREQVPPVLRRLAVRIAAAAHASSGRPPSTAAHEALAAAAAAASAASLDGPLEDVDTQYVCTCYFAVVAGACLALALRFAGTGDAHVRDVLLEQLALLHAVREAAPAPDRKTAYTRASSFLAATGGEADVEAAAGAAALFAELVLVRCLSPAVALAVVNTLCAPRVSGGGGGDPPLLSPFPSPPACWPFRLSPTSGAPVAAAASTTTHLPFSVAAALHPGKAPLEEAVTMVASAVGIVMAGTGDVSSLRVLREVDKRAAASSSYGHAMGVRAALGLLCLGGGRATLSRSDAAIAALLASVMPHWPTGSAQNSFWPQAARGLWPLAVDARCADAVDVDTLAPVGVPLRIVLRRRQPRQREGEDAAAGEGGHSVPPVVLTHLSTPCLLPELHTIASIRVLGGGGWLPYELRVGDNAAHAAAVHPVASTSTTASPPAADLSATAASFNATGVSVAGSAVGAPGGDGSGGGGGGADTAGYFVSPLFTRQVENLHKRRRMRSSTSSSTSPDDVGGGALLGGVLPPDHDDGDDAAEEELLTSVSRQEPLPPGSSGSGARSAAGAAAAAAFSSSVAPRRDSGGGIAEDAASGETVARYASRRLHSILLFVQRSGAADDASDVDGGTALQQAAVAGNVETAGVSSDLEAYLAGGR